VKSHAQVVVIGGGVIGCSVLFHLTKLGWKDVVLCERRELTSGSSWHAAGGFHALNSDPGVSRLQSYTIRLYREIERLAGQDVGLHFTGGLNIAATPERWDFLRADWARHRVLGLNTQLVTPAEIAKLCPIIDTSGVIGGMFDPMEGHLDPAGVTHAFAKAARNAGAEIYRHTCVRSLSPLAKGGWHVVTEQGTIESEHVVNAAGLWAREVGHMAGVELPLVAMEHHYLLTEDLPELSRIDREIPLILDLDGEIYLRQERKGVLLGVYEKEATPWAVGGTPWTYGENELLEPKLERLTEALEMGFVRFPVLNKAGIRRVVNGPFTFTPDGNPLVGPVPGLRNYWAACGVMAGFAQGGGVGLALSQWIVNGEPDGDVYAMDVARFGPYATRNYTIAKGREFYSRRFQIAYPNEYWPAGRPAKVSAVHTTLEQQNGVFGVSYGMEVPLYFARAGDARYETPSLRRSNAFASVAEECQVCRNGVAVIDISSFGKYWVKGGSARRRLLRVLAGRLPESGKVRLTPMLAPSGRLMGDLTTSCLADDLFLVGGSGYLQNWHMRWFTEHLRANGVDLRNVSDEYGGIALCGPQARQLLSRLTQMDVSNDAFAFLSVQRWDLVFAPAIVARLSVTGELGYEIYVPTLYLSALLKEVARAAEGLSARHIGFYALNSLRLEKSFGIWSREYSRDYTPRMAGLKRFIDYERRDFIGREAALVDRDTVPKHRLVTLAVDSKDADATGYEPILQHDRLIGFVTSGGYGHTARTSLAMGYVASEIADGETNLSVTILGESRPCRILPEPLVDAAGSRMRS
jgi:dimethylglycine dehydrogenase